MDRRTVLAVLLSLAVWYGWLAIRGPVVPPEGATPDGVVADGTAPDGGAAETPPPPTPTPTPGVSSGGPTPGVSSGGPTPAPTPTPAAATQTVPFTFCGSAGSLSTDGGRIHDLHLPEHGAPYHTVPLYSWLFGRVTGSMSGGWKPYGDDPGTATLLSPSARATAIGTGPLTDAVPMSIVSQSPTEIALTGVSAGGVVVSKKLREARGEGGACWVDVDLEFRNPTAAAIEGPLWVTMADRTPAAGSRYQSQRQPMALVDGSVTYGGQLGAGCVRAGTKLSDESGPIPLDGLVDWFGLSDRYFGAFLVPVTAPPTDAAPDLGKLRLERLGKGEDAIDGTVLAMPGLDPGATRTANFRLYLGPNNDGALTAVDEELGRAIDLGWFAVFGYPLLWLLRGFHSLVGNWGVAIILLTFLVKLVFFPMTQRSFKSMQGMQLIQPELQAIKEQYADNPQEMNRRTMALMQERGVNPLSGCLPMIVQMPVWLALYNVLLTSVELYHTRFLYLKDLTEPDPYLILPVTITFLMWLQQQLSTPAANMDPVQQQVMRWMPLVFGLMFFAFPSGLAVYVFVNMTLSILQQWVIKRSAGTPPPPAAAMATG